MEWLIIGIMQRSGSPVPFLELAEEVEKEMKTRYTYTGSNDQLRLRTYDTLQNLCDKGFLSRNADRHYVAEKKLATLQEPEEPVAPAEAALQLKDSTP